MVLHHAALHGLAGLKAKTGHHVGATQVSRSGGGGGGGGSAAASAMEYVAIFATIKAFGYVGATYLWSTTMGALVGGPVGALVGASVAAEAAKDASADLEAVEADEASLLQFAGVKDVDFKDRDSDKNRFEQSADGRLWYIAKSDERSVVDGIKYDRIETALLVDCGRVWNIPIRQVDEEEILGKLRVLCNQTGTQHEGLQKGRPLTEGEKQAAGRALCMGCLTGCGVGALCGAGVGKVMLAAGDCGGNSLASNVAQTIMIKHITCPMAMCCGGCGGAATGCCSGKCAAACSSESS